MLRNATCLHPVSESNRQAFPRNFYIEQGNAGKQISFIFRKIWTGKQLQAKSNVQLLRFNNAYDELLELLYL